MGTSSSDTRPLDMFAKPRPKKSILPAPSKKRKATPAIEEISFDNDARHEYLTGFHKRKQQRIKHAQDEAAKKARQEKIELRKQAREDRKREVEEHVEMVNKLLKESNAATSLADGSTSEESEEQWDGIPDPPEQDLVDQEEEYVDEDRFTTVTVESVNVSRDGFEKPSEESKLDQESQQAPPENKSEQAPPTLKPKKKKAPKFRYETKLERKLTDTKQRLKNKRR